MSIVLCGDTAYEYWRSSISHKSPEFGVISYSGFLAHFSHESARTISDSLQMRPGSRGDLHLLLASPGQRWDVDGIQFHYFLHPDLLPSESFYQISSDTYVVSPELCFVQFAATHSFVETVWAGTDLCSKYQISLYDNMETVECDPMTTRKDIEAYLAKLPKGTPGLKQARMAVRYITNSSRSPRETSLCTIMALPTIKGGFAMPEFVANDHLNPFGKWKKLLRKEKLEGDIVFAEQEWVFEYESNEHHGEDQRGFDYEKISTLQMMGVTVTPISTWQMSDFEALETLLIGCKHQMGQRDRKQEKYSQQRKNTHADIMRIEEDGRTRVKLSETKRWQYLLTRL